MYFDYLSPEMNYKLALLDIFTNIKARNEVFLEEFCNEFEFIPSNTLEENLEFFSAMYDKKFSKLNDYFSIQSENKIEYGNAKKIYYLTKKDNTKNIMKNIDKYTNSSRFMDGYLRNKNYSLHRLISNSKHNLATSNIGTGFDENGVKTITPFYISNEAPQSATPIFTPVSRGFYSVADFFNKIDYYKKTLDDLASKYEEFLEYVESYKEETKEKMIQEHIRFGITYLKEILSRIIIPVSCLEDEKLKQVCEEQGREVFVRKPKMEDFLFPGAHVHICSSHDLENDSSYVIKPILVDPTIPADTEELKYHGIGLYSYYDDKSKRSYKGTIPHVVGGVLYCGADLDEFSKVIPEELLEEIKICEKLVESMDDEVQLKYSEEGVMPIIQQLKQDNNTDVSDIVQKFLEMEKLNEQLLTNDQKTALNNTVFSRVFFPFNKDLLITINNEQPHGFCILKNDNGDYYAIKRDSNGSIWYKAFLREEYGSSGFTAACKTLGLTSGIYSVFDFGKRLETRGNALIGMVHYTE